MPAKGSVWILATRRLYIPLLDPAQTIETLIRIHMNTSLLSHPVNTAAPISSNDGMQLSDVAVHGFAPLSTQ
jgi:hypothetical protein